jgi:hypothetical protein
MESDCTRKSKLLKKDSKVDGMPRCLPTIAGLFKGIYLNKRTRGKLKMEMPYHERLVGDRVVDSDRELGPRSAIWKHIYLGMWLRALNFR